MDRYGPVFITHLLHLLLYSPRKITKVDTWRLFELFDDPHDEFYLFSQGSVLFLIHFLLVH